MGTRPSGRRGGTPSSPAAAEPGAAQPGPGAAIYLPWLARRAGGRAVTRRPLNEGRRMAPRGSRCSGDRAGEGGGWQSQVALPASPFPLLLPTLVFLTAAHGARWQRVASRQRPPGSGVLHPRVPPPPRDGGACKLHGATWWGGNGVTFSVVTVLVLAMARGVSACVRATPVGLCWAISRFQNEQLLTGGVLRSRGLERRRCLGCAAFTPGGFWGWPCCVPRGWPRPLAVGATGASLLLPPVWGPAAAQQSLPDQRQPI